MGPGPGPGRGRVGRAGVEFGWYPEFIRGWSVEGCQQLIVPGRGSLADPGLTWDVMLTCCLAVPRCGLEPGYCESHIELLPFWETSHPPGQNPTDGCGLRWEGLLRPAVVLTRNIFLNKD